MCLFICPRGLQPLFVEGSVIKKCRDKPEDCQIRIEIAGKLCYLR